jgi:hypothetical protein
MCREPEQRHAMLLRHLLRHPQQQHGNGRLVCRGNGRFYSLKPCPANGRFEHARERDGLATLRARARSLSFSRFARTLSLSLASRARSLSFSRFARALSLLL